MNESRAMLAPRVAAAAIVFLAGSCAYADTVMRVREGDMSCDRACLNGFVDKYLDAMAAHDPSRLPLAKDVRMTENTVQMPLTDGLWFTTTAIGKNRHYIADVYAQQAGAIAVVFEADGPKMLGLRLRIKNMKINEIEMVTARPGSSDPIGNNLPNWKPAAIWDRPLKPSERMPRDQLAQVANQYFEAIEKDSKGAVQYSSDCTMGQGREENGSGSNIADPKAPPPPPGMENMMKMPCAEMFGHGAMGGLSIPERSFWAVDDEMGVVLGAFIFSMDKPFVPKPGQRAMGGAVQQQPNSGIIVEVFKIIDGKIYRQDGVTGMTYAYGTRTGW
jgi:hypothetical protein